MYNSSVRLKSKAVFFLLTNTLVVFGLAAFDHAMAIQHTFPELSRLPGAPVLVRAMDVLLQPESAYDKDRIIGLSHAIQTLQQKSRSFYLASSTFEGELRVDLVFLYSFCRVADDLIDGSTSWDRKQIWIDQLTQFIKRAYSDEDGSYTEYVRSTFPREVQSALLHLPVRRLSKQPLLDLLKGFEIDFKFADSSHNGFNQWPIDTERDLLQYGRYVAGTVAELFLDLVFHHTSQSFSSQSHAKLKDAGVAMGQALQIVNIARDVETDAALGRVYIPSVWVKEYSMTPSDVLSNPAKDVIDEMRKRLLGKAFKLYSKASPAIEGLPKESRAPMRVAVESYMEIGRVLRERKEFRSRPGKATVSRFRRIWVAWKALRK
ncbi:MAG: hypothetical protein M1831_000607 [Alyxoria varia]|nr:MAG: hypothetical protein M1831_000607 [Alyxoria varia]